MRFILDRSYEDFKHEYLYHGALIALNVGAFIEEEDEKIRSLLFSPRDSDVV